MKRPSREEYQRAVALAREAIREGQNAPRIRADRSPQAVLAKMQAKAEKGEAPTKADLGAMAAALAELTTPKKRGRGRPKGARDHAAHGALQAAIWGVQESEIENPYRNNTGPRRSQCDAIAEAMQAEGFRTLCSYDAARREMVAFRRICRPGVRFQLPISRLLEGLRVFEFQLPQLKFDFSDSNAPFVNRLRQSLDVSDRLSKALEPMNREMQEVGRSFAALAQHIRAQTTLPPVTRQTIERRMKTKR